MAIYHLSVKNGGKGFGGVHAQYIQREGIYASRDDLRATESGNMPAWAAHDAGEFWAAADRFERANGRTFRELEVALPRELNDAQRIELVRDFVDNVLGDRHAYTWAIHAPDARDQQEQPHLHLMFSERSRDGIERDPEQYFRRWNSKNPERGGAGKDRYLSSQGFVWEVRQEWADTANAHLERAGYEVRIDPRSYRAQGLDLEPQLKEGFASYVEAKGSLSSITAENRGRAARNGERLVERPEIAIAALTAHQSVFSRLELQRFVTSHTDSAEQFEAVMLKVIASQELVSVQKGDDKNPWFTSRELHDIEQRLVAQSATLAGATVAAMDASARDPVQRNFNAGQGDAYRMLTGTSALAVVNGAAGTGKSYVLSAVREAYENAGCKVVGAALQGKTADDLQRETGIESSTLHRLVGQLDRGERQLDSRTVLVIDEAGLVGSRQMLQVLDHVARAGAVVRLVGDTYQLHAVDAGDAFRAVSEQAGRVRTGLTEILRQREDWQKAASTALSEHRIGEGLEAYRSRGFVSEFASQDAARDGLLDLWKADRAAHPERTQLLVTHVNRERQALNEAVREIRRDAGELGADQVIQTATRRLPIAEGERIVFMKNDSELAVKNGTLGTVQAIDGRRVGVKLDDGRELSVDTREYGHVDHGYALTIHKSQGVTVDQAYLLATSTLNAQLAYVASTRHREGLQVAYSREQFAGYGDFVDRISRIGRKEFAANYTVGEFDRTAVSGARLTIAQRQEKTTKLDSTATAAHKNSRLEEERRRIEGMTAAQIRSEIWRLRIPEVEKVVRDNPEMAKAQDALRQLTAQKNQADFQAKRALEEANEWRKEHPVLAATGLNLFLAKQARIHDEQVKISQALVEPITKSTAESRALAQRLAAEVRRQQAPARAWVAETEGVAKRKDIEERGEGAYKRLVDARSNGRYGYRDGDREWERLPPEVRSQVDRWANANAAERDGLLREARRSSVLQALQDQSRGLER